MKFSILDKQGVNGVLAGIRLEVDVEGRTAVGIVVDANDDIAVRWQAVTHRLQRAGMDVPKDPAAEGTIIVTEGRPRVGVWLMPDNRTPGELEDFIAAMIPASDAVWPLSESYIDGIPANDQRFSDGKIMRAKVHAWLATRNEPRLMGAAISARDLNTAEPNCARFLNWLRRLFG